jgi:hypothetical protein
MTVLSGEKKVPIRLPIRYDSVLLKSPIAGGTMGREEEKTPPTALSRGGAEEKGGQIKNQIQPCAHESNL